MGKLIVIVSFSAFVLVGCGQDGGSASQDAAVDSNGSDGGGMGFDVAPSDLDGVEPTTDAGVMGSVEPDFSRPHSRIEMKLWYEFNETGLSGYFADGPQPEFQQEAERIGQCRLLAYRPSLCDPGCPWPEPCVDGQCLPWPILQDRGLLHWTWPDGAQDVEPNSGLSYFAAGDLFGVGDASITVDGMTLTAPTLDGVKPNGDWSDLVLSRGDEDPVLAWGNPVPGARVRLKMTDCTGSHGGVGAFEVECEGPDTGQLVLPASFLDTLDRGNWGHGECGVHELKRYHRVTPAGDSTTRFETVGVTSLFYRPDMQDL